MRVQKRIAADILKTSPKKIKFDKDREEDIKESITRADIKGLIIDKAISKKRGNEHSRVRARKNKSQKAKGSRKGHGSRKGKATARESSKDVWVIRIRKQKELLKEMRNKKLLTTTSYRKLYMMAKGGFFRSKRHLKLYIDEHKFITKE